MDKKQHMGLGETLRMMNELLLGHRLYTILLFVVILAQALAESIGVSMMVPLLSQVVDTGAPNQAVFGVLNRFIDLFPQQWRLLAMLVLLCSVVGFKSIVAILNDIVSNRFIWLLREEWSVRIFASYLRAPVKTLVTQKQGALMNNVVVEPQLASKAVKFILEVAGKLVIGTFLLLVLVQAQWQITLAMIGLGAMAFLFTMRRTYGYSIGVGQKLLGLNQESGAIVVEGLSALKPLKAYGMEQRHAAGLVKKMRSFSRTKIKFTIISNLPLNLAEPAIAVALSLFLLYYGYGLRQDLKSVVPMVGLFAFVAVKILSQASFIVSKRMEIVSFLPSMRMIHYLVRNQPDGEILDRGEPFERLAGDISFENVDFSYDAGHAVCRGLNLVIARGKLTAIAGPSGSGKSTVAEMLLRLLIPDGGRIVASGRDIREFSLVSWRNRIGYVSQEPYLVNVSIRDNIRLGRPDATQAEIEAAARGANAHMFIQDLPAGYDTIVGDRGQALSGGQRQRVAIARALVRDPEILVFDEATSSLDSESERLIREAIEGLSGKKTVLVIAHRLSTIQKADVIYQMTPGGGVRRVGFEELR